MSDPLLGQFPNPYAQRDAVHVAIIPVVASSNLSPGERIGVTEADGVFYSDSDADEPIGIVDPFLTRNVKPGERFYLCLFPGSVYGMRHHWLHPQFQSKAEPNDDKKEMARLVIKKCADEAGLDFDEIIRAANDYLDNGEYLVEGSRWYRHHLDESFWGAFEVWTGRNVPSDDRGSFFSCSC